jgi:hypothetical protein
MSEFSENYHLRSNRTEDAVEVLRRAGRKGYVFPPAGDWVSFVVDEGVFEPDEKVVAAASLPLLHFVSADDHGWSFTLFDRGTAVSAYASEWENDITSDDSGYSREALQRLVPSLDSELLDEFERRMHPKDFDELLALSRPALLAQALGLEHYEWLNYDYMATDGLDEYPEVIEV